MAVGLHSSHQHMLQIQQNSKNTFGHNTNILSTNRFIHMYTNFREDKCLQKQYFITKLGFDFFKVTLKCHVHNAKKHIANENGWI